MIRPRLVKVLVKPIFVLDDDGKSLTPVDDHPTVEIPAADWPTYSSERFPREIEAWEKQLNDG